MTHYIITKKHAPRLPRIDRSGVWPRITFAFWTWDVMPDAIFGRVLSVIDRLRSTVVQVAPEDAHTMGDRVVEDARELDGPSRMTRGRCG